MYNYVVVIHNIPYERAVVFPPWGIRNTIFPSASGGERGCDVILHDINKSLGE